MTKKHKRSPYEDLQDEVAAGASVKAAKQPRGSPAAAASAMHAPRKLPFPERARSFTGNNDNASGTAQSPGGKAVQGERMSIEELEQKKMLLPYLDKIEYINVQLRARGLLPDDTTTSPCQPQSSMPHQRPLFNNGQHKDVLREGDTRPMQQKPLVKTAEMGATNKSRNQDATPIGVTRQRSESQLPNPADDTSVVKRTKVATDALRLRYPRLFSTIDRTRLSAMSPRIRPINWLLHLIEDVYDELTEIFVLGANTSGTVEVATVDGSPRPEVVETNGQPTPPSRLFQTRLVMPLLVRKHIENTLGLPHLADQECLDLLCNVEAMVETFASVAMFSMFVREIYDEDTLLFYLFVRLVIQREFDLQFKAKTKVAHSSLTGKKYIAGDVVRLVAHPLVPDGSKTVLLTRMGCEQVWKRFFVHEANMKCDIAAQTGSRTPVSPVVLGHYITTERMAELFNAHDEVAFDKLLVWSIDAFRNVAEDIVAQFKFKDDGESLRGLIRLRETISSDVKISKLTTLYSERERSHRNMKIDLLRLERSNTEENKNRTQLRLVRNQIGLLEQELEHIQTQIAAAESLVNDVWRDVTATSPTKRKNGSLVPKRGEFVNASTELASVVSRFAAHIARLQRKHDIEVKAASMLTKPWKKQMEELQLRMVIRIQRAYRARRRAREIKQKAKEELHEKIRQREIQKQNVFLDRKRQEAHQEKDVQRHQARMLAKQQQENAARDAVKQSQYQLVERMRFEQIAERDHERNTKLLGRMLQLWKTYVSMLKKRRDANRLFVKFQFLRWRHHFAAFKHVNGAASLLQRLFRRRREKVALRKAVQMKKKRGNIAKRYLQKIQSRQTQRVFNKWMEWATEQIRLKANFQAILQRRTEDWFQRWVRFTQTWKLSRLEAVLLVQRVYRGRLARRVVQAQRLRSVSSQNIQRVYRGYRGRQVAASRRKVKQHQDIHCALLLQRICNRALRLCVAEWRTQSDRAHHIKRMSEHRRRRQLDEAFGGFVVYRGHKREKRAAFFRRQYESAVLIQRHYRRHRCQFVFRTSLLYHRAAIKIQRVFRGFQGRQGVHKLRWEIIAAKKLQTAWRQRQAWRLAEKTRAEGILLAAYKGDFTATQRAITSGYWYIVDDEHNGILHMAAAAGHKRLVKLCLRHRMDINAVNLHGQTPLHLLLANIPPCIPGFDEDGETQRNVDARVALAAYMIDHNAWHEATDELGLTPLLLSAALGQTDATEMLLEKSADTDARSHAGLNAVQLCVEGNHAQAFRVLLASQGFNNESNAMHTLHLLHACAGRGFIDCLRILVEHLAIYELAPNQLNLRDDDGYTPLIYAISNANVDAVRCLLESGANPDEKDFFGRSPLHFAVTAGDVGSPAIVELLAMYDVDVNVKDTDGDSALHTSCDRDARLECTSLLLRSGAVIGANTLGNHPAHIAARNGAVETLKLLVDYGADMNIKNYEGKTPLGLGRMLDQKPVVQYIKQYFAAESVSHKDEKEEQAEDVDLDEASKGVDDESPQRTQEQWEVALESAYRMGTLAEWTQYVDAETEFSFFACQVETETEASFECTWETPIEFDAALSDTWEVMRKGGSGVALRSRLPPELTEENNTLGEMGVAGGSPRTRAGLGVHYLYLNKHTGETRVSVPPIDYTLLQDVVQHSKRRQHLRRRIRKVSADTSASAMEYMRFFHEFEAESTQTRTETLAAITIQRHFRARRTKRMVRMLLLENKCAVDLQRAFRGRQARKTATLRRHEHVCATKIQALWRGHRARNLEQATLHSQRVHHRHRHQCALKIQRLFRGHRARLLAYREKVIQKHGPTGYFAWEQTRRQAVVKQTYKVWDELELRAFPGVYFYCHHVTRSCAWEKSKEWQAHDLEQFHERCQLFRWGYTQLMQRAAIRLQSLWRARQARISFRLIMKSVQLMKCAEREYLEDPNNLVKMGNYVLFLHAILHDYDRARPIYGRLMRTMAQRGPDIPFILFSYALFLYVTQEDDVALVEDMIARAKAQDRQLIKYKMAFLGFFRQSMLQNPHDGESNLNYAACLQLLFEQYEDAIPYYLRAIAANPHKKGSMELFQDMLNRKKQVDKAQHPALFAKPTGNKVGQQRTRERDDELQVKYNAFEMFRRWQVVQAEEDDLRRRKQFEADQETTNRLQAARKIQARYRRRQAMRKVNRLKVERQLAISMSDLADTKAVYERVRLAFDQVAPTPATTSSNFKFPTAKKNTPAPSAPAKPMSVPMAQLDDLFRALDLTLSQDDFQGTVDAFRAQYGKALHVNVMDVTSFAQSNALVAANLKETKSKRAQPPPR